MTAVARHRTVARLGLTGAGLGVVAGIVQVTVGNQIPEWTGAKAAPAPLGLLTVALSVLAVFAAFHQRRPALSIRARAACALGLGVPGLLCLTTVGRLWYVPSVLLVVAAALCVDTWRGTAATFVRDRCRVLLTILGGYQLLMAAGATPLMMVVGGAGGLALIAAAWARPTPGGVAAAVALGTLPFAVLGWAALVPVVLAIAAAAVGLVLVRQQAYGDRPCQLPGPAPPTPTSAPSSSPSRISGGATRPERCVASCRK